MRRGFALSVAAAVVLALGSTPLGAEEPSSSPPGPDALVHVPVEEIDVLLEQGNRGVVLRYDAYRRLVDAARARAAALAAEPPVDAALAQGMTRLDLTPERAAQVDLAYTVQALGPGTRSVAFPLRGVAVTSARWAHRPQDEGTTPLEVRDGVSRLRVPGSGVQQISVKGAAAWHRRGGSRFLDLHLPPAAASQVRAIVPPGFEGTIQGEGPPRTVKAQPTAQTLEVVPERSGRLRVALAPAARSEAGPPILDATSVVVHRLTDGLVQSEAVFYVDTFRSPTTRLTLTVPAALSIHDLGGSGVTAWRRSEDRTRVQVDFGTPRQGRTEIKVVGELPLALASDVPLPALLVDGSVRMRRIEVLKPGSDVRLHGVTARGGRRVAAAPFGAAAKDALVYALTDAQASLQVDAEPTGTRVEATSTWYWNLAEAGKTLLATTTYRVERGRIFALRPRFPADHTVRSVLVDGQVGDIRRERRADGTLVVHLGRAIEAGQKVGLIVTLEQPGTDWLPESGTLDVALPIPVAGADRQEAVVAVGADAAFDVREGDIAGVAAVGAGELSRRGLEPAGLLFGYRVEARPASIAYAVRRHAPHLEADAVTVLRPTPRRLTCHARVLHRVDRAGVRELEIDVPAWAGLDVHVDTPLLREANPLAEDAEGVPPGYRRWRVALRQRVIGLHALDVRYHLDLGAENWRVDGGRPLVVRAPVARATARAVIERAEGLEVRWDLPGDAGRIKDVADLPAAARVDATRVLAVLHMEAHTGLSVGVQKHDGAAVLDAIATQVHLQTAVGRQGTLRTRATVELFNIQRQFLTVRLPSGSALVGAIVDQKPVKPLRQQDGTLLIPVPTARQGVERTIAVLNYETDLGDATADEVSVEVPVFPRLEVLHTVQEVAFEPGLVVASLDGDLHGGEVHHAPTPAPWIQDWVTSSPVLGTDQGAASGTPVLATSEPVILDREETDNDMEESFGETEGLMDAPFEGPAHNATIGIAGGAGPAADVRRVEALLARGYRVRDVRLADGSVEQVLVDPASRRRIPVPAEFDLRERRVVVKPQSKAPIPPRAPPPSGPPATPDPALSPAVTLPPQPDAAPLPADMPATTAVVPGQPGGAGRGAPDGAGAPGPGDPRSGPEGGPSAFERQGRRLPSHGRRRKGLLSLDVPVWLAPNRVVAQRLGTGGTLHIRFETEQAPARRRALLTLVLLAAGLILSRRPGTTRWLVAFGMLVAGWVLHGASNGGLATFGSTLANAGTVLVGLWGLVSLVSLFRRGAQAPAAVAALFLAVTLATPAHADEPRPEVPDVDVEGPLYLPYDPADPETIDAAATVVVPLETWTRLFRAAHPELDPEVVRLGRTVSLAGVDGTVDVEDDAARVQLSLRFVKRGTGMHLVRLPLAGIALAEARLDGQATRLLLDKGAYLLPLEGEGAHTLEITGHVPRVVRRGGSFLAWQTLPHPAARLLVRAPGHAGRLHVQGRGRASALDDPRQDTLPAVVHLGAVKDVRLWLADPVQETLPEATVIRGGSDTIHSLRDDGTERAHTLSLHVLQGEAPFVDVDLDPQARLLEVQGKQVVRYERLTTPGRVRLHFERPQRGRTQVLIRTVRLAEQPDRLEDLVAPWVVGAAGGHGRAVINVDPDARLDVVATEGWVRVARPRDAPCRGPDQRGRIIGAWTHAAKPGPLRVRLQRATPRLRIETAQAVGFGGDRMITRLDALVRIERVAQGELVFALPGVDEVRRVESSGVDAWWLEGEGDARRLFVRYRDLRTGDLALRVHLERVLGGMRDGLLVPRWSLEGAGRDTGRLVLYAQPEVDPVAGAVPGLQSVPLARARAPQAPLPDARPVQAFLWQQALTESLPVALRTPEVRLQGTVISLVAPRDDRHRLEHLLLFDVRRGATDRVQFFLPDGGHEDATVVRTRDLREMRRTRVTRQGPDGVDVPGTIYDLRLQSSRDGLIEVVCTQLRQHGRPVRFPEPLEVAESRWFTVVRTFSDGMVDVSALAGPTRPAEWADLPFVPTGLDRAQVIQLRTAVEPFALGVQATRQSLEQQAEAIVLVAVADAAVGHDGMARVRMHYRVFNRARQFLRLKLPDDAVLFGATAAGDPVKPLRGAGGTLLVPIPKVPLGGAGYPVSVLYRTRAGRALDGGSTLKLRLPEVPGLDVDRTVVRVLLPEDMDYRFQGPLQPADEGDVAADLALATLEEVRDLLEVAQNGTLEQRFASAQNARRLLKRAQALQHEAGNKVRVVQELQDLQGRCVTICGKAEADWQAQQLDVSGLNPSQLEFGGNAADLLEEQTAVSKDAGKNRASWRFNDEEGEQRADREDVVALKKQIGQQFAARGGRRADRAPEPQRAAQRGVAVDQSIRANLRGTVAQGPTTPAPSAGYDVDNLDLLNGALRAEQVRNRQLGRAVVPGEATRPGNEMAQDAYQLPSGGVPPADRVVTPNDVFYGIPPSGVDPQPSALGRDKDAGIFFADRGGVDLALGYGGISLQGTADGAGGARYEEAAAKAASDAGRAPRQRAGLMGVDVPLPQVGRLFHFRGHDSIVLEIEAEPEGSGLWIRILVVLLLSATAVLLVIARRRATVRPAA